MSTDYAFQCHDCRLEIHAGQRMALSRYSWGYGSGDESGRMYVATWAMAHVGVGHDVRLVISDDLPDGWTVVEWADLALAGKMP